MNKLNFLRVFHDSTNETEISAARQRCDVTIKFNGKMKTSIISNESCGVGNGNDDVDVDWVPPPIYDKHIFAILKQLEF